MHSFDKAVILINNTDGHNKFWRASVHQNGNQYIVIRNWGRVGQLGLEKTQTFPTEYSALLNIAKLKAEKERDSYNRVTEQEFEKQSAIATAIGTANKIREIQWLEFIENSPADAATFGPMLLGSSLYSNLRNYTTLPVKADIELDYVYTTVDRLSLPSCKPGLMLDIETKKKYQESNRHNLIISEDHIYSLINLWGYAKAHVWYYKAEASLVEIGHPLYDLAQKIQKAAYHIITQ